MAGFKSAYLSNKLLDHVLGGGDYTRPATVYAALMTTAPTAAGGGTESTGGGYARVSITNNSSNFPAASAQVKNNGNLINFGTFSADLGTIVGIALYDNSSGGNLLYYGPLTVVRLISNGDSFSVAAGGGTFTEA